MTEDNNYYPPLFARFELRTISPHFGHTICGIYDNIEDAREALELKRRSQSLPCIIYDAETDKFSKYVLFENVYLSKLRSFFKF